MLYSYLCKVLEKWIDRIFAKNFAGNFEKIIFGDHQILGQGDNRSIDQSTQHNILKNVGFLFFGYDILKIQTLQSQFLHFEVSEDIKI